MKDDAKAEFRELMRMVLPENYTLETEIAKLKEKVEAKYGAGTMD